MFKSFLSISLLLFTSYSQATLFAVADCKSPQATATLEVNNVRTRLMNGGDMFWDIFGSGNASYEIPKNSGKHSSFAGALWLSALDAGNNLHTAGQTYRQSGLDFWAGPLDVMGESEEVSCREWDKMFTVFGEEIVNTKLGKNIAYNISRWPSAFAPFYDQNGDGVYDPSVGDYPILDENRINNIPNQMIFWVFNDKGNEHTSYIGGLPLGIEIRTLAYAYSTRNSDIVNNSTIYKYKIINKSINGYDDFIISKFLDVDLGNSIDDYIGCDLSTNSSGNKRNLFYSYNADLNDEDGNAKGYGLCPPSIGVSVLNCSKGNLQNSIEMGSFIYCFNGSGQVIKNLPRDATELNNYLHGLWNWGTPMYYGSLDGTQGTDTTLFAFPGNTDPEGRPSWFETFTPGDRKMILNSEGTNLLPGEILNFEYAIVWARDSSATGTNLTSLEKLRVSTDTLISAYKNNFANFSTGIERKRKDNLVLYPNPSKEFIQVKGILVKTQAKIYNQFGQVVRSFDLEPNQKIMINELANGIYFLKIDKQVLKFMKN